MYFFLDNKQQTYLFDFILKLYIFRISGKFLHQMSNVCPRNAGCNLGTSTFQLFLDLNSFSWELIATCSLGYEGLDTCVSDPATIPGRQHLSKYQRPLLGQS